jgi:CBS domain-containing protein
VIFVVKRRKLPLRVEDIMSTPPVVIELDATIADAARAMKSERVGSVLVVDKEGKLRGIVTERDIVFAVAEGWDLSARRVWEVMSENPIYVRPDEPLDEAVRKMRSLNVRHIPVVDEEGKPVGMVPFRDVLDTMMTLISLIVG